MGFRDRFNELVGKDEIAECRKCTGGVVANGMYRLEMSFWVRRLALGLPPQLAIRLPPGQGHRLPSVPPAAGVVASDFMARSYRLLSERAVAWLILSLWRSMFTCSTPGSFAPLLASLSDHFEMAF